MIVHLPQHLVTLFVGGALCVAFVLVAATLVSAMEKGRGGPGTVPLWEAFFGTCMIFGVFYGVGWLALRYL
jgi:hypothetical protein